MEHQQHGDVDTSDGPESRPDGSATPPTASGEHAPVASGDAESTDPLLRLRAALDGVDELPLLERAEVFERTHRVVVDELRALELG